MHELEGGGDIATPWTAAHQAPPSMGFSKQEYWSQMYILYNSFEIQSHGIGGNASLLLLPSSRPSCGSSMVCLSTHLLKDIWWLQCFMSLIAQ